MGKDRACEHCAITAEIFVILEGKQVFYITCCWDCIWSLTRSILALLERSDTGHSRTFVLEVWPVKENPV